MQLASGRTQEVREQPGHPDDERQDPEPERQRRDVLERASGRRRRARAAPRARRDRSRARARSCRAPRARRAPATSAAYTPASTTVAAHRLPHPARRAPELERERSRPAATTSSSSNCVRANTASADPEQREHVVPARRRGDRELDREHGPEERRIGGDLGEQERREDDPRQADREQRDAYATQPPAGHAAREQERRDAGRAHHPGVHRVRVVRAVGHEPVAEGRCDQERIELVQVRDQLAVHARERRAELRHADREPLVEQLVRHHEPVDDACRERREDEREPRPEREERQLEPRYRCARQPQLRPASALRPGGRPRRGEVLPVGAEGDSRGRSRRGLSRCRSAALVGMRHDAHPEREPARVILQQPEVRERERQPRRRPASRPSAPSSRRRPARAPSGSAA